MKNEKNEIETITPNFYVENLLRDEKPRTYQQLNTFIMKKFNV